MDAQRILPVHSMLELFCVLIVSFSLSLSQAQGRIGQEENSSQGSYFFYQSPEYPRDCRDVQKECSSSNSSGVFLIRPDGYPEPFEAFCNNEFQLGGWTVIQRLVDGSVDFNRDWQEYKKGFGFLSTEFWLGNEKLSYLTNQANYELRIDIVVSNGTSLYASYAAFRISDEWSQYSLVSVGDFHGDIELSCPRNMVFGNCSCRPSCDDPSGLNNCNDGCGVKTEACVCASGFLMKDGKCVLPNECRCFLPQTDSVLLSGETHVNDDCSEKCICEDDALSCNSYRCDSNAVCGVQDSVRECYCNEGYEGTGETCTALYTDCYDAYQAGHRQNGVYTILPTGWPRSAFNVSCDMTTASGGWTIFQKRIDGVTNFYRSWADYKHGFGSVQDGKEFWLGNEQLHYLTNQKAYKLRVDIVDSGGTSHYGEYTTFQTQDENAKYRLSISGHSGDTTDGLLYTNGASFSTFDQDNDGCSYHNCAQGHRGAWWYKPSAIGYCYECHYSYTYCYRFQTRSSCNNVCARSNLNGNFNGGNGQNMFWHYYNYCNLNSVEMKIRPSFS